ncbi:hypothetical protein J5J10_01925 [Ciceribacter sp. L1K23]|uniref:hypothetical protein n=1 Tax=Ciceribacter sp. L1K23 TaxID=2820276 RepID=UPI001B82EA85|nr:hypothetical protein [Ciceribacter sp. L1K23]MBR0554422.1 hypothetical protein [Ciceribacter sp. L1K23]
MADKNIANVSAASARLFRAYFSHCTAPDLDTLFQLLGSIHSLNDRVTKGLHFNFLNVPEFLALKCLRNFFHHHDELKHTVRLIPITNLPIVSDLVYMCLTRRELVEEAIKQTAPRHEVQTRAACQQTFHWYGTAVNINPCLFNFVVRAYERLAAAGIQITGGEAEEFRRSYEFESEMGHSHYVDGRLSTPVGNVNDLLSEIMDSSG